MAKTEKEQTAPASAAGEAGANEQARPQQLVKVRVTRTGKFHRYLKPFS